MEQRISIDERIREFGKAKIEAKNVKYLLMRS